MSAKGDHSLIGMKTSLQGNLNGETLPSADNYNQSSQMIGSRATLDELHFGKADTSKVIKWSIIDKSINFKLPEKSIPF